MPKMQRVMIVGSAGSGKSTLAIHLGKLTGLPVVHVDKIYWKAGWVLRDVEQRNRMIEEEAAKSKWIFEGNNSATFEVRISKADTLIFLDLPTWLCFFRVLKRIVSSHGVTRPDMATGCPERFDLGFLKWVYHYRKRGRPLALELLKSAPSSVRKFHLTSPAEVREFLTGNTL